MPFVSRAALSAAILDFNGEKKSAASRKQMTPKFRLSDEYHLNEAFSIMRNLRMSTTTKIIEIQDGRQNGRL